MGSALPVPSFFPNIHFTINDYLAFNSDWAGIWATCCFAYYFALEPVATVRPRPARS